MTVFSATEAAGEKTAESGFRTHSEVRAKRTRTWIGCECENRGAEANSKVWPEPAEIEGLPFLEKRKTWEFGLAGGSSDEKYRFKFVKVTSQRPK